MSFPYTVNLDYGSEKITGTAKKYSLGTRGTTPDGRVYYYALNGGTAIETGRLVQAPVMEGTTGGALQGGTSVFVTAGSSKTTGATTVAFLPTTGLGASQLVDGWLIAMTTPSRAMYKVKYQPTSGSSLNAVEITLYEQDKLIHPLPTAHRLALIAMGLAVRIRDDDPGQGQDDRGGVGLIDRGDPVDLTGEGRVAGAPEADLEIGQMTWRDWGWWGAQAASMCTLGVGASACFVWTHQREV